jgi:hypothetical protein
MSTKVHLANTVKIEQYSYRLETLLSRVLCKTVRKSLEFWIEGPMQSKFSGGNTFPEDKGQEGLSGIISEQTKIGG